MTWGMFLESRTSEKKGRQNVKWLAGFLPTVSLHDDTILVLGHENASEKWLRLGHLKVLGCLFFPDVRM